MTRSPGRPAAPCDQTAALMQERARELMLEKGLNQRDLAQRIRRSPGAVGLALNSTPAKNSQTLRDIINYFSDQPKEVSLADHARELAARSPETAALLSAVLRELADLLVLPLTPNSDRPRTGARGVRAREADQA